VYINDNESERHDALLGTCMKGERGYIMRGDFQVKRECAPDVKAEEPCIMQTI